MALNLEASQEVVNKIYEYAHKRHKRLVAYEENIIVKIIVQTLNTVPAHLGCPKMQCIVCTGI